MSGLGSMHPTSCKREVHVTTPTDRFLFTWQLKELPPNRTIATLMLNAAKARLTPHELQCPSHPGA